LKAKEIELAQPAHAQSERGKARRFQNFTPVSGLLPVRQWKFIVAAVTFRTECAVSTVTSSFVFLFYAYKVRGAIMEIKVTTVDHFKFAVQARAHSIICDQPAENGGQDSGMTPPELLLASLGTCAQFYALQYLRTRNLDDRGLEVTVSAEKLKQPARLGNFRIQVTCSAELTVEQTEGLERSVHQCLIHNTLLSQPELQIELAVVEPALR
jgi:uncharacterized OsmC-like protein